MVGKECGKLVKGHVDNFLENFQRMALEVRKRDGEREREKTERENTERLAKGAGTEGGSAVCWQMHP